MKDSVISIDPETMGGTPVFKGTRVPIRTFIDYMGSDDDIREFFDNFPGVSREQIIRLIEELDNVKERILVSS
uniref:Uncharacterized conserved protein, DUF433 family n=1 Tax=Candidatus Kentrum sp. FM TaxID=2126340 RepID=A0A450U3I7_9GAMM|nr:MAG: Uncharacterized conserved protein, DUF433 family [Candidatus Kentron sp. FM]VFJ77684.1 MAG: Uncharacterized conserved protein, DUF433 family [Candidatus Kentron sp. FM]VFK24671.1 MAG: Uncharacterized conserved protein, DUF433 family [Candidatus Kentron sp. FM]